MSTLCLGYAAVKACSDSATISRGDSASTPTRRLARSFALGAPISSMPEWISPSASASRRASSAPVALVSTPAAVRRKRLTRSNRSSSRAGRCSVGSATSRRRAAARKPPACQIAISAVICASLNFDIVEADFVCCPVGAVGRSPTASAIWVRHRRARLKKIAPSLVVKLPDARRSNNLTPSSFSSWSRE